MAAVMLAGMVPPLALALATVLRPGLFNAPERENGKAGWALGASFITEGAIPFAAADPLRVIPSIMLGSAVTGGLSMAMDVAVRAPHGGIFVLFAVDNILGFFIALVAGVVVGAVAVIVAQVHRPHRDAELATVDRPVTATDQGEHMPSKTVVVGSVRRPARPPRRAHLRGRRRARREVLIGIPGDEPVDASSALLIMTLGAGNGDTVEVTSDDQAALDKIAALVEQDLDA